MPRIGIITYHFAENYGSVFQCLALFSELKEIGNEYGVDVEVLDFITQRQKRNNALYGHRDGLKGRLIDIAYIPFHCWRSRKRRRFNCFVADRLELSPHFGSLDELEDYLADSGNEFCCLVSGSDQVWSPLINDFDVAFFLPFEIGVRKVGYGISLGNAMQCNLSPYVRYMAAFDAISFRESHANAIVRQMGIATNGVVCDPVFLKSAAFWERLAYESQVDYSRCNPYMAVYLLDKENMSEELRLVHGISRKLGLEVRIINAGYSRHTLEKGTILDAGPLEFLNLWRNAGFICTDSFHGTALAVRFKKQFVSFDRPKGSFDTRKRDLLDSIGLLSHSYRCDSGEALCLERIDYSESGFVETALRNMKTESEKFIRLNVFCEGKRQ